MTSNRHDVGPLAVAVVLYLTAVVSLVTAAVVQTGTLVYPIDDTYIHMSIARTLSESGTWGIRAGEFAGASSSPLWTLVLAIVFLVLGPMEAAPLLLNIPCGLAALWLGWRILRRSGLGADATLLFLVLFVLATPLPFLAFSGMEHSLQVALLLLAVDRLQANDVGPWLCTACALSVATRYESAFPVAGVTMVLALRKQWTAAIAALASATLPVLAYGLYATTQGGSFVPASILLKSGASVESLFGWLGRFVAAALEHGPAARQPEFTLLLATLALVSVGEFPGSRGPRAGLVAAVFWVAVLLHGILVQMRWLLRYEAFVVALGILALAECLAAWQARMGPRRAGVLARLAFALVLLPLLARSLEGVVLAPYAAMNIQQQHVQVARFLAEHYDRRPVALNDIGAPSFYSRVNVVDLAGLATHEVAQLRFRGALDSTAIARTVEQTGAPIAVLYPEFFRGRSAVPDSWVEVCRWTIPDRTSAAFDTVAFYATSASEVDRLARALQAFRPTLPAQVSVSVPGEPGTQSAPAGGPLSTPGTR